MSALTQPKISSALKLWKLLSPMPLGKWMYSKIICFKAPYFSSISPKFETLETGLCKVSIPNKRSVHNHIGTVHAIAMCNMAELAGGTMTEVSIPLTHRWIPKGMTVQYLKKAETDLLATAQFEKEPNYGAAQAVYVDVKVTDVHANEVFQAKIEMWVAPKK